MAFNEGQAFGEYSDPPPTTNNNNKSSIHTHRNARVFTSPCGIIRKENEAQRH